MRKGNVFSRVCLSVQERSLCDQTWTCSNFFTWGHCPHPHPHAPPSNMGTTKTCSNLFTLGPLRPPKTCSNLFVMSPIHILTSGRLAFDWKPFLVPSLYRKVLALKLTVNCTFFINAQSLFEDFILQTIRFCTCNADWNGSSHPSLCT